MMDIARTSPNPLLHSFCRAVRATCNVVRNNVFKADVREEEDFVTAAWGLPMEGDMDETSLTPLAAEENTLELRSKEGWGGMSRERCLPPVAHSVADKAVWRCRVCV